MVFKSLGKKLKSIGGKKKDKKSDKVVEPPKKSVTFAEPEKSDKGPGKRYVEPKAPPRKKDRTPITSGNDQQWKPGAKGDGPKAGVTIGGKRAKTTAPVTEDKGTEEKVTEAPKVGAPTNDAPKGVGTPYSSVMIEDGGASGYSTSNPLMSDKDEDPANKYLMKGDTDDNPYSAPSFNLFGGGTNYNTGMVVLRSQTYSDTTTSSSDDDLPVAEEYVDEAGHVRFRSQGTSAFQHSDPNQAPGEKKEEVKREAPEEKSEHLSESESNPSDGGGLREEIAIGGYGANKYLMNDRGGGYGKSGGYTNNGYTAKEEEPGNKYLVGNNEDDGGGYRPLRQGELGNQSGAQQSISDSEVSSDEPSKVEEKVVEEEKQLAGAGAYAPLGGGNKYTTSNNNYTNKYTGPLRDDNDGGGTNYTTTLKTNYSNYQAGTVDLGQQSGSRQLLSISTSETQSQVSVSESVESFRNQPMHQNLQPDVQPEAPQHTDDKVALMQKDLRLNTRYNKDVKEVTHGVGRDITRVGLSKNEKNSRGWGVLPMRDTYRNRRNVMGKIDKGSDRDLLGNGGPGTQYFISRGMQLDYEARKVLASNLKQGRGTKREDTVLRFAQGKWLTANGEVADTTDVKALDYSINEFREKLSTQLKSGQLAGLDKKLQKVQEQIKGLSSSNTMHETMAKAGMSGRWIYVMNAAGEFFAGKSQTSVVHHSSFLAGGAVASAGEVAIAGGTMTAISNVSGHYRPGPVYLWQAVKQLELLGVPLSSLRVDVMGVNKSFKNAAEFVGAMDPASDPNMFDAKQAIDHLNKYFAERTRNKELEKQMTEKGEQEKGGKVEGLNK